MSNKEMFFSKDYFMVPNVIIDYCSDPNKVVYRRPNISDCIQNIIEKLHEQNHKENEINGAINNVIFNNPATIVYWKDGTKTVVKCQPCDEYSKEVGFAMCIIKKICGNKGNYNDLFEKWCK